MDKALAWTLLLLFTDAPPAVSEACYSLRSGFQECWNGCCGLNADEHCCSSTGILVGVSLTVSVVVLALIAVAVYCVCKCHPKPLHDDRHRGRNRNRGRRARIGHRTVQTCFIYPVVLPDYETATRQQDSFTGYPPIPFSPPPSYSETPPPNSRPTHASGPALISRHRSVNRHTNRNQHIHTLATTQIASHDLFITTTERDTPGRVTIAYPISGVRSFETSIRVTNPATVPTDRTNITTVQTDHGTINTHFASNLSVPVDQQSRPNFLSQSIDSSRSIEGQQSENISSAPLTASTVSGVNKNENSNTLSEVSVILLNSEVPPARGQNRVEGSTFRYQSSSHSRLATSDIGDGTDVTECMQTNVKNDDVVGRPDTVRDRAGRLVEERDDVSVISNLSLN